MSAPAAGYSGTPLPRKLGIKTGHRIALLKAPPAFATETLGELAPGVTVRRRARGPLDVIVAFVHSRAELERGLAGWRAALDPAGGLWIAWPKQSSGVASDLREGQVREAGLAHGLVDNKVCAIDATWSGLRFVFRLADRPREQIERALASTGGWPGAAPLVTERLWLEPLTVAHAPEMALLLHDPALHAFTGGRPLTASELRTRYERLALGASPDGGQHWLNWIVRERESGDPVGSVQATLTAQGEGVVADLAWVIAVPHQRRGYATEAAAGMVKWLREQGADVLAASIDPHHEGSMRVARALGLAPTEEVIDGEVRWLAS
ncbi:MAG TPA: GNAT family N-acetyltransferase [Solirubrobacteraceae bacterium]|jgi:RimJ/RimL family protein N-acetyltransferase|nr:GNAT family N-acetyltransferase [Solirubrobacteraceae bacterium]